MGTFQDGLIQLENLGVLDVIVPFILIFTVVFAVLQKTKILGEDKDGAPRKNFNVVIALVMALAAIIPHVMGTYTEGSDVIQIINDSLPNVSVVLIAIIMLLLIMGVFGGNVRVANSSLSGIAVIFAIVATIVIFGNAANWFELPDYLAFLEDPATQSMVVVILVFAAIIWFVMKDDKPKDPKKLNTIENLAQMIGYEKK